VAQGAEVDALLADLAQAGPAGSGRFEPLLRELLETSDLFAPDWDPKVDGPGGGIVFGESLYFERNPEVPWRARSEARVEQAATLVRADLASIKAAENDYRQYPRNIGAGYEAI